MPDATPKAENSEPLQQAISSLKAELALIDLIGKREFSRLVAVEKEQPLLSARQLAELAKTPKREALLFCKKRNACRRFLIEIKKKYTLSTRQGYLVDIRREIGKSDKQAEHFLRLTDFEVQKSRVHYRRTLVARHHQLVPLDPFEWKERVGTVLDKILAEDPPSVVSLGVALMAASGRRQAEIFALGNLEPYPAKEGWLWFTGQAKTKGRNESVKGYAIPCLADADKVLQGFRRLRSLLGEKALSQHDVNRRYSPQLGRRTLLLFGSPFYPHLLRAAYGFVTYHEWCPEHMTDEAWLALVLGHKMDDEPDLLTPLSYKRFCLPENLYKYENENS